MSKSSGTPGGRRVEPGAHVVFEGRTWQVAGVGGSTVRLVDEERAAVSLLASYLFADPGFKVIGVQAPAGAPRWGLFETVPLHAQERALAWQRHIREVETGLAGGPGSPGVPRPQYDPERKTLAEREQAKAEELAGPRPRNWPRWAGQESAGSRCRRCVWTTTSRDCGGWSTNAICVPRPRPDVPMSGWWRPCWRRCGSSGGGRRGPSRASSNWPSRPWTTPMGRER